jgi:hypothetical protein
MSRFSNGWRYFRDRAQLKEERQHFGLAWSALAAFFLAVSVFIRSFRESGWLLKAVNWLSLVLLFCGVVAVYLALAVALRLPPHNPKQRNSGLCNWMASLAAQGRDLLQKWEGHGMDTSLSTAKDYWVKNGFDNASAWVSQSDEKVKDWLGDDLGYRFEMARNLTVPPPQFASEILDVDLWQRLRGRLDWITIWLQDQGEL